MSDGGHNVTEVHGGDDAILAFVLLGECLACMLQLQLLKKKKKKTLDTRMLSVNIVASKAK